MPYPDVSRGQEHLAFPGIGLGGLAPEAVLEVLEKGLGPLRERVRLYRKERG